jgi:hypothetical protein
MRTEDLSSSEDVLDDGSDDVEESDGDDDESFVGEESEGVEVSLPPPHAVSTKAMAKNKMKICDNFFNLFAPVHTLQYVSIIKVILLFFALSVNGKRINRDIENIPPLSLFFTTFGPCCNI